MYDQGDHVESAKFGLGQVILDDGRTVVAQFEHGIERCLPSELAQVATPAQAITRMTWDVPLEVVVRMLAEAIQSVNDMWGVLSKSRIALLPHQLWVCRRVLESWPTRWLVADDVGLGKTIEAGLILWPLLTRDDIKRILILCPASLVEQWQYRLRTMFDIRLARYVPEADDDKSDFWHTHPTVVASLQTLRKDNRGRHGRLLEAPRWDLILIDEAHHLNSDERGGLTLGYRFVERLVQHNKVTSMVFLTGTPHRGKDYGFIALLKLLRPDLFDPRRPLHEQLPHLRQVLIRNNKNNVTDLKGKRLFLAPKVTSETYVYSSAESRFYDMLTEFIATGKAYASTLSSSDQRTAILVLIAMQKLASSSVAAIHRAFKKRLGRIQSARKELSKLQDRRQLLEEYEELESGNDADDLSRIDEKIAEQTVQLKLMEDEEPRLVELIAAADAIASETKIEKLLVLLEERFPNRTVLFFTEYKATQSLLMSALLQRYGTGCVTFINGDGRADDVIDLDGKMKSFTEDRATAATKFNDGSVRFLVSTEAAGEGIDLQENCHTLVHVDLPWNPMRLHQRVGRLNRYGQKNRVEVMSIRNPNTVESLIWDKLNIKIDSIMRSLGEAMDEPEDLLELVLGMTSPAMFREIFSEAGSVSPESLNKWFDEKTATFGGQDVLSTVRDLVGHCAHFDFQQVSEKIPRVDLPALKPFFLAALSVNKRKYQDSETGLAFKTPDSWLTIPSCRAHYRDLVFERSVDKKIPAERIMGIGHPLVDQAIRQARAGKGSVTAIPQAALPSPLITFRITDKVTSRTRNVRGVVVGIEFRADGLVVLPDWELLIKLNGLLERRTLRRDGAMVRPCDPERVQSMIEQGRRLLEDRLEAFDLPFDVPELQPFSVLWPSAGEPPESTVEDDDTN